jgi:hypothetical protein
MKRALLAGPPKARPAGRAACMGLVIVNFGIFAVRCNPRYVRALYGRSSLWNALVFCDDKE